MQYSDQILLAVRLESAYGRSILRGVNAFARPQKPWVFRVADPDQQLLDLIQDWNPTGIIVQLTQPEVADSLAKLGRPVVTVSNYLGDSDLPRVGVQDDAVGRSAAQHFLERKFKNFAFIGYPGAKYSNDREAGYALALQATGNVPFTYYEHNDSPTIRITSGLWAEVNENIRRWVTSLVKPVAVMACNDLLALQLAEICRQTKLRVPEDVAIVGADNDELLCDLATPPLSSVAIPGQRIGHEAAAMLDAMLQGGDPPREPLLLPPPGVVTRQSSDVAAMDDRDVSTAIAFINDNSDKPIDVSHVVKRLKISRRSLERRFRAAIGRSPLEEIRRVRIERAKHLLVHTSLAMPLVAQRSGFSNAKLLSTVFHQETGVTPTTYRRQFGLRDT